MTQEFSKNLGEGGHEQTIHDVSVVSSQNVTFNQTQIIQISVDEVKTRKFNITPPYKGLKKFESEDKDRFFGRDQFLTGLVNELEQTNFVLLLGASGSGKSSVIRAGLIPWLAERQGSHFMKLVFTPDQDPFESLYASLLGKYKQSEAQIARITKEDTLTQLVRSLKQQDAYWFIFIDQLEELFTTTESSKRDVFIKSLVQLVKNLDKAGDRSVKLVATMRADFLDRLSPYPDLIKLTDKHRPMIAEMQLDELRLAIEQPAAHHGVVFETGLIKEIIDDVQGQAGYLPLLQYTLDLLWATEVQSHNIEDRTLNISNYRKLGGVRGALQLHVNQIYGVLSESEKLAAQRIFLKLVGIGEDKEVGTEWKPVRRRANRSEFSDPIEQKVLTHLINQNLLVSNRATDSQESTVEIAHEVLLTSWNMLQEMIKDNRRAIAIRNRLNDDALQWQKTQANEDLWSGSKLEQALELREDKTFNSILGGFTYVENQFIDFSRDVREKNRVKELKRARVIAIVSFTSSIAFVFLALFAGNQARNAENQSIKSSIATSKALISANQELEALIVGLSAGENLKRSVWLRLLPDTKIRDQVTGNLQKIIYEIKEQNRIEGHTGSVEGVVFSPNNDLLASFGKDNTIRLWDLSGHQNAVLEGQKSPWKVIFNPKRKQLASYGLDDTVRLWDFSGKKAIEFKGHKGRISDIEFSPDGERLAASGVDDDTVYVWDLSDRPIRQFKGHQGGVWSVAFNPKKYNQLATSDGAGSVRLWNLSDEQFADLTVSSKERVSKVIISPDGKYLATNSSLYDPALKAGITRLWDISGKLIENLNGNTNLLTDPTFSPDSRYLASTNEKGNVDLLNLSSKEKSELVSNPGLTTHIVFNPNESQIATTDDQGIARLWSFSGERLKDIRGLRGEIRNIAFSSDGKYLATAEENGIIRLFNFSNKQVSIFKQQPSNINTFLSPDGNKFVSVDENHSGQLGDISNNKRVKLEGSVDLNELVFSHNGKTFATTTFAIKTKDFSSYPMHIIRLWNSSGQPIREINSDLYISRIALSPNGKYVAAVGLKSIGIWDLLGNKVGEIDEVSYGYLSFSPDNTHLVTIDKGLVNLWDLSGRKIAECKGIKGQISSFVFSPDGQKLVTGSQNGFVQVWNLSGKQLAEFKAHIGEVSNIAFSPDGKELATTSAIDAHLWDLSGKKLASLQELEGKIQNRSGYSNSLVFSPDGQKLVTGSENGVVQVWSLSGDQLAQFKGHTGAIKTIVFSSDNNQIKTIGDDNVINVWKIDELDALLERGCYWIRDYLRNNSKVRMNNNNLCTEEK